MNVLSKVRTDPLTKLKGETLEQIEEIIDKNDDLLTAIDTIHYVTSQCRPCLGIKPCFRIAKPLGIDTQIKSLKPKYDAFKKAADQIEKQCNESMFKPLLNQVPQIQDFLSLMIKTKKSCDALVNGSDLEFGDFYNALELVHTILLFKVKPTLNEIKSKLE